MTMARRFQIAGQGLLLLALASVVAPAFAVPIPSDITVSCAVSYDAAFSDTDPGTSHTGRMSLVIGGSTTVTAFSDGSV